MEEIILGARGDVRVRINEKSNVEIVYPILEAGCLKMSPALARKLGEALIRLADKGEKTWTVEAQSLPGAGA
jgi:hypothetical protein